MTASKISRPISNPIPTPFGRSSTTTADGTPVFHMFGALAQFERDLTRERTMADLAATRVRGGRERQPGKLTPALRRRAEAMLRDRKGYLFVSEVNGAGVILRGESTKMCWHSGFGHNICVMT